MYLALHILIQIVQYIDYSIAQKYVNQHICKALEITKDGKKGNVLCIVDRSHERFVVVLDHFKNFKDI